MNAGVTYTAELISFGRLPVRCSSTWQLKFLSEVYLSTGCDDLLHFIGHGIRVNAIKMAVIWEVASSSLVRTHRRFKWVASNTWQFFPTLGYSNAQATRLETSNFATPRFDAWNSNEQLTVAQLAKRYPLFYWTTRIITLHTRDRHWLHTEPF